MNKRLINYSMALLIGIMLALAIPTTHANAAAPATLKYGSTGPDVPDLQYRLKTLGYFDSSITLFFGDDTY
ncbi:peptidoglycan-binding protein, partial [Paenibacillus sp. MCAF20]